MQRRGDRYDEKKKSGGQKSRKGRKEKGGRGGN